MRNKITVAAATPFSTNNKENIALLSKVKLVRNKKEVPKIVFITTFPPRECGIATYSQDLIVSLQTKFKKSFQIEIVALESDNEKHEYTTDLYSILKTDDAKSYSELSARINENTAVELLLIQHEFGLFRNNEADFIHFLNSNHKPVILAFHTVLPRPDQKLKNHVLEITEAVDSIIVMTNTSASILEKDYGIDPKKITVIPHGTHLVEYSSKNALKKKYQLSGRKIISTFGLLSSGKSIETSLQALRQIVKEQPDVLFLVIGKTHPTVVKNEGERYRNLLEAQLVEFGLQKNVRFINAYLPLPTLLEYLQLTDIYLFTSKDRNQAVSGTFSYAISCGCPVISTPIPHAVEVLQNGTGIIIDFENPEQLAQQVVLLLKDDALRNKIANKGIHKLAPTAWENSAIAHAFLFKKVATSSLKLKYHLPSINLNHFKKMTTDFGMIQFSIINQCDIKSGYTLDDNARALVAICQHYELTKDPEDIKYIKLYYNYIKFCFQNEGSFLNYVNENKEFTSQNSENLDDANGRAIWALGYLISLASIVPAEVGNEAEITLQLALPKAQEIHSTRAMAFIIKGLYYRSLNTHAAPNNELIHHFADQLVQMFRHESNESWHWFESYLTYANSILPEALLCAYLATGKQEYKLIAKTTFDFLLTIIFKNNRIKVVSNKGWISNSGKINPEQLGGEQPIDVAYTILALNKFYTVFEIEPYFDKMETAFSWFLGNNHLHQIIYNPCTGGCYDGLEDSYINLNQGAESTVSYLMARLAMEKQIQVRNKHKIQSGMTAKQSQMKFKI